MTKFHRSARRQEELQEQQSQNYSSFSRPIAWQHSFYVSGFIDDACNYNDWFEIIRNAGPDDIIRMNINSIGGSYSTALQFRRVMAESMATIECSIEGSCHSAASVIYLSGDSFIVAEGSSMLIHDYSSVVGGKGSEMIRQIQHDKISIDTVFKEVYKGFLTDQEIQNVISGQDLWCDDSAIVERTQKMSEKRAREEHNDEEFIHEQPKEEEKKKTRSRKK